MERETDLQSEINGNIHQHKCEEINKWPCFTRWRCVHLPSPEREHETPGRRGHLRGAGRGALTVRGPARLCQLRAHRAGPLLRQERAASQALLQVLRGVGTNCGAPGIVNENFEQSIHK